MLLLIMRIQKTKIKYQTTTAVTIVMAIAKHSRMPLLIIGTHKTKIKYQTTTVIVNVPMRAS